MEKMVIELITFLQKWGLWRDVTILTDGKMYSPSRDKEDVFYDLTNVKVSTCENPDDYDAMAEVMWASSLSHNWLTGLGRPSDFSVHKFGHALSVTYGATHGASLTAVWKAWAEYLADPVTYTLDEVESEIMGNAI